MSWSLTSWIFLAVAHASKDVPADLSGVIEAADKINRSMPSQWELQRSLGRLQHHELVLKENRKYSLTELGTKVFMDARGRSRTVDGILEELAFSIPDTGVISRDRDVTVEAVRAAAQEYLSKKYLSNK
jgi:hypothetical protein